jgi:hypothetical protein
MTIISLREIEGKMSKLPIMPDLQNCHYSIYTIIIIRIISRSTANIKNFRCTFFLCDFTRYIIRRMQFEY